MQKIFILKIAPISLCLFSWCCSAYEPQPQPTVVDKTIMPGKGSTFTFNDLPLDLHGTEIVDSIYTSKDSVVETGLSLFGKSNVMHVIYKNTKTGTNADRFYNYESNGDISIFIPSPISKWITFVFHDISGISGIKLFDTTITSSHIVIFDTINTDGWNGQDTFASKRIGTEYFKEFTSTLITNSGIIESNISKAVWVFAPALGYFEIMGFFSRVGIPPFDKFQPPFKNDFARVLTSFSLK